jgi:hypothetical protein
LFSFPPFSGGLPRVNTRVFFFFFSALFKESGGLHSVRRSRAPTSIYKSSQSFHIVNFHKFVNWRFSKVVPTTQLSNYIRICFPIW